MAIDKPINELLLSIDNGEYKIPEFQRGYVWNSKQVKEFFRSLFLGYPSGSFLIWKTKEPSKLKGDSVNKDSLFHQLILDGQQRLTTIYTIFRGKTPNWYEGQSLRTDLYFSLEEEEFEYYMPKKMANKLEWINVSEFLSKGGVTAFITMLEEMDEDAKSYYLKKLATLNKLGAIKDYGYYIKEISESDIEKVVEIFNLVNKTGTTLNESDLSLAIMTSNWPEIKDKFRESIEEYKKHNYELSFMFFTRCLNILTTERGKYTSEIANVTKEEFEIAWKRLHKILPHIVNVLRESAFVDSTHSFSSKYVLYILIYYLHKNEGKFTSTEEANKAIYWMFNALLWGRFSGSSESYLEKDMNILKEKGTLDALIQELHLYRGSSLKLRPEDLALQGNRSRIFNIFYSAIRSKGAKDWTNPALSLYSKSIGINNKLEKHHIFPKAFLYKKYNSANSIHKAMVNEIANIAFITKDSNLEILTTDPAEYLPKIDAEQLKKQFVPTDSSLHSIDNYELFLDERRKLICDGINRFLASYFENNTGTEVPRDLKHFNNEIERIEIALRALIADTLDNEAENDAYQEYIPGHIKEKAEGRIKGWLAKNPGEEKAQFENLRRKLDFFDLQEYKDIIISKDTWNYFESKFGSKGVLMNRFSQLGELRNSIRHSRDITEATFKDGEAAIAWFGPILRAYLKKQMLETELVE